MTATQFIAELFKRSWQTAAILIADEDEEVVHERTEELGVLGAARTVNDTEKLKNSWTDSSKFALRPAERLLSAHVSTGKRGSSRWRRVTFRSCVFAGHADGGAAMEQVAYKPIGLIHSPFTDVEGMPIQPSGAVGIKGTVELNADLAPVSRILTGSPTLC